MGRAVTDAGPNRCEIACAPSPRRGADDSGLLRYPGKANTVIARRSRAAEIGPLRECGMAILLGLLGSWLIQILLTFICVAIAKAKGRNPWLWGVSGYLFGVLTLIVLAARPGTVRDVRDCPQCDTENDWEAAHCSNCGASLRLESEGREVSLVQFVTPLAGLTVGLLVALVVLQVTRLSPEAILPAGPGNETVLEQLREQGGENLPVLFWPASPGLSSAITGQSAAGEVWRRLPITLQMLFWGGALAVLLAWGLALGLRRQHPGITAGRLFVASQAALPVFWWGLLALIVLARTFEWSPPVGSFAPWEDPKNNLLQLIVPVYMIGIVGGLWTALEMRSREGAASWVVLLRVVGLVLRHGGMLLSGIVLLEALFGISGLGQLLIRAAVTRDAFVLGAAAATFVWLAVLSRYLGNMILIFVDGITPTRSQVPQDKRWGTLAIGGGISVGLLVLLFLAPFGAPQDPLALDLRNQLVGPGGAHWFGSDQFGRDVLSRVLHGGRTAAALGLPMALLALLVGVPMFLTRVVLERDRIPALLYGAEGFLEGLVAVPWLVLAVLIQVKIGVGWPFLALAVIIVPRALQVGWALGAGEHLRAIDIMYAAVRLAALFLASAVAMSVGLGFLGLGVPPSTAELGLMLGESRGVSFIAPWTVYFPGLVITMVVAIWLGIATLISRAGPRYRAVAWARAMS